MKIAFFDSGIGGLTVLKEALCLFPNEEYIYFADSDHAPYGAKSQQEVESLIADAVAFLVHQNIEALVLACHTASRLMKEKLQAQYDFPVIGMETGLEKRHFQNNNKKVLVTGTDLSIKAWQQYFCTQELAADYYSLQGLIPFAEKGDFYTSEVFSYIYQKLAFVDWTQYQAILLGCTHFPFYKNQIRDIVPGHIEILDGSSATVQQFGKYIPNFYQNQDNDIQYFISGEPMTADYFLKYNRTLKQSAIFM